MKRSEIIKLLTQYLAVDREGIKDARDDAEELLTVLEKMGMQPPKVKTEEVRRAISPKGEEGTFISWTYKSVWEPENEKK